MTKKLTKAHVQQKVDNLNKSGGDVSLTKAQNKRFDEKFEITVGNKEEFEQLTTGQLDWYWDVNIKNAASLVEKYRQNIKKELKQFLADELARVKHEAINGFMDGKIFCCIVCREIKPNEKRDGWIKSRCVECENERKRLHALKTYNSERARKKYLKRKKEGKHIIDAKNTDKKYPEKNVARGILRSKVKYGKIKKQSCRVCGSEDSQAHHEDYSKPLEVMWYCEKHHSELHRKKPKKAVVERFFK